MSQFHRALRQFCGSGLHFPMMGFRELVDPSMPGSRRTAATHFVLGHASAQRIIGAEDRHTALTSSGPRRHITYIQRLAFQALPYNMRLPSLLRRTWRSGLARDRQVVARLVSKPESVGLPMRPTRCRAELDSPVGISRLKGQ